LYLNIDFVIEFRSGIMGCIRDVYKLGLCASLHN